MSAMQHVYVTAHGNWTAGSWTLEKAQIGLRLAFVDKTAKPDKGSTFTIPLNGDVVTDSGTATGTHGTLTRTWKARIGAVGSVDNMNDSEQVDLAEDMWTFLNAVRTYQSSGFQWTHVKIAPILADGSYGATSAIYQFTSALPGAGGAGNHSYPPEVAAAVSFRAPVIGRSGRGRFYLPALHTSMGALDGTIAATPTTSVLGWAATLVAGLENLPGWTEYDALLAVTSAGKSTAVRPTQIRLGSHFDSQRRRQQQQPEIYAATNL